MDQFDWVIKDSYDNVVQASIAGLEEIGYKTSEKALPPETPAVMSMYQARKGNLFLAQFLGFIFKVKEFILTFTAFDNDTTQVTCMSSISAGGVSASSVVGGAGGLAGGMAAAAVDDAARKAKMSKDLQEIYDNFDGKFGDKVAQRVGYTPGEGPSPKLK